MKHPIVSMGRIALLLFLFSATSNLILVKPAWAQSSPSVPEFTVNLQNGTLDVTIKNQPFASYNESGWKIEFFYNIRMKEHTSEDWIELYRPSDGYPTQSGDEYTVIRLGGLKEDALAIVTSAKMIDLPLGSQEDFQVQAMIGYVHRVHNPNATNVFDMYPWIFTGETSGWSSTQTVTIEASPQPSTTPTPTANATSTPTPEPTPTQPPPTPESSFSDDFSSDSGAWQYLGSAYRNQTSQNLVLTTSSNDQTGVAFLRAPIQGSFRANFSYKAAGDGFVMFFYKQKYPTTIDWEESYGDNGVAGGRLGFNTGSIIPGYGIEFDGWANIAYEFADIVGGQPNPSADPSDHHIALIKDFTGDHLAYVNDQRIYDNVWHQVSVVVQGSSVTVYLDQVLALRWSGVLDRTYDGFGFSGSNGQCEASWHLIDNFSITAHNLQQPTLTTVCKGTATQSSLNVKINGDLTLNGTGISGAPILLSYSVTGGKSWQDLTLVNTDSNGSYSAVWFPSATGNYLIKAVYEGNENCLGTVNIVNFAMELHAEQSVFSVTSNSTLSELSFNSATKELSFSVSGENGTTGYVTTSIPKTLISDISDLKVLLDGNQISYQKESQDSCWLLSFTYHHSAHSVVINLNAPAAPTVAPSATSPPQNQTSSESWIPYVAAVVTVAAALTIIALVIGTRRAKSQQYYSRKNAT